jgi:cob(I)alamin adenosyltransferase
MPRLTRLYTRKGDDGGTGLGGGQRVAKDSARVAAYGTVDELSSAIGVALALGLSRRLAEVLPAIQNDLFNLGADLCFVEDDKQRLTLPQIEQRHVEALEHLIDDLTAIVGPLENFILPGGTPGAAELHLARTICRRAERDVVALSRTEPIGRFVLAYLNRLSDALFAMARYENHERKVQERLWDSKR